VIEMNRELKVFMFVALAILMASACLMMLNTEESDAYGNHGTSSSPLSSLSLDGYDCAEDSDKHYYVYVGSYVSIECCGDGGGLDEFAYNITGCTSGYGLTYNSSYYVAGCTGEGKVSGTISKAGTISVSYDGWNGGNDYNGSITIHAVAQSTSCTCYLYYNANGGSGAPSTQSYTGTSTSNHSFTISSTTPSKSGYTFLGWSTSSSATSASYQPGSSISVSYNGSKTLYAVWQQQVTSYSVTVYKGNWDSFKWVGGSDSTKYTSSSHTYTVTSGTSFDIDWYGKSSESGSGTDYSYTTTYTSSNYNMATSSYGTSLGDSVTITSSGKYYPAVQMTSMTTYTYYFTIKYNANGGSGAPSDTTATNSTTTKSIALSSTTPTRSGYTFLGWSTNSSATSASYSAGSSYTFNYGTTTLYAVWKAATITVTGTPDSYGVVGSAWSFKPTVSESGCSVSISGASWLSANGTNVSGTPISPGTYNVTLTFSKTGYTSATKFFSITVLSALSFESSPTGGAIIYAV